MFDILWGMDLGSGAVAIVESEESGEELAGGLMELRYEIDKLELRFARMAARFAATDYYDQAGSLSAIDWIRHNCHMTDAPPRIGWRSGGACSSYRRACRR